MVYTMPITVNKTAIRCRNQSCETLAFNITTFDAILQEILQREQLDLCPTEKSKWNHPCSDRYLQKLLAGYMYPIMLLICLVGNSLNTAVYSFEFMRKSLTVKILAARAAANSIFVLLLMFEAMKTVNLWDPMVYRQWESLYWHMWPYVVMFANIVGSTAMWITVLMILERYLYVMYPLQSRHWCTGRNLSISIISIIFWFGLLHSLYPITHYIEVKKCRKYANPIYLFKTHSEGFYKILEKVFHWTRLLVAIFIPMSLMVFMSGAIAWRLLHQRFTRSHSSAEKRCITVMTLTTTVAHLILESPHVVVFIYAVLGANQESEYFCNWSIVSNFLATCNASILFFIYLAFSSHFRELLLMRMKCQSVVDSSVRRTSVQVEQPTRSHFRLKTSDTNQEQKKLSIKSFQETMPLLEVATTPRRCRSVNYASTDLFLTIQAPQTPDEYIVSMDKSPEDSCNDIFL